MPVALSDPPRNGHVSASWRGLPSLCTQTALKSEDIEANLQDS